MKDSDSFSTRDPEDYGGDAEIVVLNIRLN